jgi:nucleotide-binding universal stress UspA family protein
MYKKILAPLDGSDMAECTIEHVKEIARAGDKPEVIFLSVLEPAHNAYWFAQGDPDLQKKEESDRKKSAENYLLKIANEAKKDGLAAKGVLLEGNPADVIIDYAGKNGVDLIVMSTHGRSGLTRFAMGSVTDKVLRTAAAPVLAISPKGCRANI